MVLGINDLGESSAYLYNGLGALVENTWVIKKNAYGYHDVSALTTMVEGELVVDQQTGRKDKKDKLDPETVAASPTLNKTSTVVKQFVVDYTSETFEPLMEYEVNGLDYRYVYGNDRLSVDVKGIESGAGSIIENGDHIRLYYHMDYLGTADYLTSPVSLKVESWTHYNEWGEISHNAVLKCGQRELDLVKRYATHDYDSVLDMYYAKARFYDAGDRRFVAIDPILDVSKYDIKDYVKNPVELVQYLYVQNNPVIYIDIDGLRPVKGDTDLVGAYLKKQKETQRRIEYNINYRQEHSVMFLDGIAPTEAALISKLDLYKAKDYNEKIKKCEEKIASAEGTGDADLDFYRQHSPMTEGMAGGMYGSNFWNWFFGKFGLLPEGYDAIPYSGEHADLYKSGELLGNSIPIIYGTSELIVPYLQKMLDKVTYVESAGEAAAELTRAQSRNINTLNNIIDNNLTAGDFSGTLADLQGKPIPKPGGGFWDHLTEMKQSYTGLQNVKNGLEGSLKNPNLIPGIKAILQENLDKANFYINKIDELFRPFGGIK